MAMINIFHLNILVSVDSNSLKMITLNALKVRKMDTWNGFYGTITTN